MPYVNVRVNRGATSAVVTTVLSNLTDIVHAEKGDAVAMISATIETDVAFSFGGDAEAAAGCIYMTATAFTPDITARLTRRFTAVLGEHFGVHPDRMYVFFRDIPPEDRHMVGWNGKTFLELVPTLTKPAV